jgi:hypothetical protein
MRNRALLTAILAAGAVAGSAHAAATIDVDNLLLQPAGTNSWSGFDADTFSGFLFGQTWTVGVGGQLSEIDLVGQTQGTEGFDVTLSVLGGATASLPGTHLLGSVTKHSSDIVTNGMTAFDLSSLHIDAAVGEILTWEMSVAPCAAAWPGCLHDWINWTEFRPSNETTPAYPGGFAFGSSPAFPLIYDFDDANFRTWMSSSVPEPAVWLMCLLGFASAGVALRRQRRLQPQ